MTPTAAQELAEAVVADGFGAHRAPLAALFAGARRLGVNETVVAVAADPDEIVVVRQRALGRVVVDYSRLAGSTIDRHPKRPRTEREPVVVSSSAA